ncbi:MAG: hypothetical protein FD161_314 [Limisphaerales bacterium]|nr:MAG: hypothetical protein FD161_314 [Limisphaerales bacterium]KAG0510760.1 MAG: hypothetical protein E1N63_314 [Limisphaerales bacterium]TXT52656.1 MAG: hypothetical protein FD140_576 [Limisphaerales bacterium]
MSAKTRTSKPALRASATPRREPTHDEIALCAMTIWVEEGRPQGRDLEHWLLAESRLRQALQIETDATASGQPRRTTRHGVKRGQPEPVAL